MRHSPGALSVMPVPALCVVLAVAGIDAVDGLYQLLMSVIDKVLNKLL